MANTNNGRIDFSWMTGHKEKMPLDKGRYTLEVQEAKVSDYGSIQTKWVVLDGPEQKDGSPCEGRTFNTFLTIDFSKSTDAARAYLQDVLFKTLKALGIDASSMTPEELAQDMIGKSGQALVRAKKNKDDIFQEDIAAWY